MNCWSFKYADFNEFGNLEAQPCERSSEEELALLYNDMLINDLLIAKKDVDSHQSVTRPFSGLRQVLICV